MIKIFSNLKRQNNEKSIIGLYDHPYDGANALVGTWSRDYSTADVPNAKEVYTFNNNGTGSYKNAYQTGTFTYVAANGYIVAKIKYSDFSTIFEDEWPYTINGNTLTLNGNQYKKQ